MSEHLVISIPRDDSGLEVKVDAFTGSGAAQDAFFVAEAKGYYAEVVTIYRHPRKDGTMGDWWGGMWTGYGRRNGAPSPAENSPPGVALGRQGNLPPADPPSLPSTEEIVEVLRELVRLGTSGTGYVHASWIEAHEDAKALIAKLAPPQVEGREG